MDYTESEKWIKIKQWKEIVSLRSKGLTYDKIGKVTGVSRQRCHQIVQRAKAYTIRHDDELSKWILSQLGDIK